MVIAVAFKKLEFIVLFEPIEKKMEVMFPL
jgi:hypothetical protein